MNWQQVSENWPAVRERVKETWLALSESDVDEIHGNREVLVRKLQSRYGVSEEDAQDEVDDFAARVGSL